MSAIVITAVAGLAFVEDSGRPGRLYEGLPRGGALIRDALAIANRAVGNEDGTAAIERHGALTITARGELRVGDDRGRAWTLRSGEPLALAWEGDRRARYLAVRGGIDVPEVLGSRATMVAAGLGGHQGRALRAGDVLSVGAPMRRARIAAPITHAEGPIRVLAGPDLGAFAPRALEGLTARAWRISRRSDRTGTPLEGPAMPWSPSAPAPSTTPMIEGAIELPPSGEPIVLGPDHPITGGYPVVAVVSRIDLDRFHAIPLGGEARFVAISLDEARALLAQSSGGTT